MTVVWKTEHIRLGLTNDSSETQFTRADGSGMAHLDGTGQAVDFSTECSF